MLSGQLKPGQTPEDATAGAIVEGSLHAAMVTGRWSAVGGQDEHLVGVLNALDDVVARVKTGDLRDIEALMVAQAVSMNAVCNQLLLRAHAAKDLDYLDKYLRLAFKAQSQCRATFETVALAKNPPVFARQANIAHGPQQVNNGVLPPALGLAHAEKPESRPIELLEAKSERMDAGAAGKAGAGDQELAPVGRVNRTKKRRG